MNQRPCSRGALNPALPLPPSVDQRPGSRPRRTSLALAAGLLLAALPGFVHAGGNPVPISGTFYVSPSGNDAAAGDIGSPLATIGKAKELAATWINLSPSNNTADIYLRAGSYALLSPASDPTAPGLTFTPADTRPGATITFRNYTGETAIIHGALEFVAADGAETGTWSTENLLVYDGGTTTTSPPAAMKSVTLSKYTFSGALRTELATRIANLRAAGVNGGHFCFTELYVNNTRKIRARTPNARPLFADTAKFTVPAANAAQRLSLAQPEVRIDQRWVEQVQGAPFTDYTPVLDGHTEIVFTRGWQWGRGIITSGSYEVVDGYSRLNCHIGAMENPPLSTPPADIHDYTYDEGQLADFGAITSINIPAGDDGETWNRGRLENNKLFVDRPGEWFFDDENVVLYYFPAVGEVVTTETFQIPVTHNLVSLQGTEAEPVTGVQFIGEGSGNFNTASNYRLQFQKSAWKYENNRGNSEFYSSRHAGYVQSGAIDGVHVDALKVAYCKLAQFGSAGISLGGNRLWASGIEDRGDYDHQTRGVVSNTIIDNNYVTDGGGVGIRVDHYPRLNSDGTAPLDNTEITSNFVTFIGKNFADGAGILVPHGTNTWIYQNSVDDVPYIGIKCGYHCYRGSNEAMDVRANGIVRAMRMLMDGGGIYTGGSKDMNVISNTLVSIGATRDADCNIAVSNPRLIVDIYLDLSSRSFTVSNNAASEFLFSRNDHNTAGQSITTLYYSSPLNTQTCPAPDADTGCCGP